MIHRRGRTDSKDVIHYMTHKPHPDRKTFSVPEPYCRTGFWHVKMSDSWADVTCPQCKAAKG